MNSISSGHLPIRLDRGIPFVDAIFRIIELGDGLDAAVRILRAEEALHGVELVRREESWTGSGPGDWMPNPPRHIGYHEFLELVSDYDAFQEAHEHAEDYDVVCAEFERLFPFLSATSLVLSGMDFTNDHLVRYSHGLVTSCSQRSWAGLMSCWADLADWQMDYRPGEEDRFYFYHLDNDWIEDYDQWSRTVHRVIAEKCKLRRADPADADGLRQSVGSFPADPGRTWAAKDAATIAREKWYCMGASEVAFDRQGYGDENVVRLSFDFVRGLSFLARLPNLRELRLGEADVADLSALAGLTNLEELTLRGAKIRDLSPLTNLQNLKELDLTAPEVADADLEKLQQALPNCEIL